jgi:hypothetical protein
MLRQVEPVGLAGHVRGPLLVGSRRGPAIESRPFRGEGGRRRTFKGDVDGGPDQDRACDACENAGAKPAQVHLPFVDLMRRTAVGVERRLVSEIDAGRQMRSFLAETLGMAVIGRKRAHDLCLVSMRVGCCHRHQRPSST